MNAFAFSHTVVFLADNPQQNGVWLLTLVSEPVFNALSYGTNHFAPYGSLNNHHLIGESGTESQSELSTLLVL